MVLLVPAAGLVFTAAPGTASTSLLTHVARAPSAVAAPEHDVVVDGVVTVDAKHSPVAVVAAAGLLDPAEVGTMAIITSTRNPFDFWAAEWHRTRTRWRALLEDSGSWVHRQVGMRARIDAAVSMDFGPWLERALGAHRAAGTAMHLNAGHISEATQVLRMEHLDEDFARACPTLAALGPIEHLNATAGRPHYRQLYDADGRDLVEAVHRPDLERFGYGF